ncbi:MAG: repair protein RecO protein [Parcubacteria group bacterium GW2011_GWA1_44_13]|uniref:Repair protein RecO protein n=1 Tax=Candidatus Nomurabacteria bacterium GW2011_GWB1_44_12 TaxID=1618748 RepID=A0A837IA68_9BACT|nr:MAG: repair protein RecO protein [Candidatus Nomurabacteria bacterium GW2011_GWD1_44_10]KKT37002.1 MAG: repair protein RecO protein [Candidatus Nomurabacteria bacterium GW2011_GWB1_44_12]KKT37821.1 MAG: repair protein RecO protein [Parcubacteria group bacterium GW2011_GWA1_44_13]KKT60583.1 MAG: repair protein RecO protein [Parcubacteria group bacterium GW2011_GWC1_44_26]
MSHHIYHTRGIILASNAVGESNRFYKIFTEELGLVGGSAQSVREEKSKLRYTLQDLSFVTVDLVRGKEVWRIVSAGAYRSLDTIKNDPARLKLFASYCGLLSRLLHGEGRDQEFFDEIIRVIDFLEKGTIPQELTLSFETLATFRVLAHLGYVDPEGYKNFFIRDAYSADILMDFEKIRSKVLPKISEALSASHL